jgi:hypothetical protein
MADAMGEAHICLGVFGGGSKASRVLPFKLYYALAGGFPVISQAMLSTPEGAPMPPIHAVDIGAAEEAAAAALAARILELAESRETRASMAQASAEYFDRCLSDEALLKAWRSLLDRG